jgi:hypothetical protein
MATRSLKARKHWGQIKKKAALGRLFCVGIGDVGISASPRVSILLPCAAVELVFVLDCIPF